MSAVAASVRARTLQGRAVVVFCLYGYFAALIVQGGHTAWDWFQVPATSPSFLDLRSVTSGWECARKGIDVLVRNPCDPFPRPANYPRMWLWPSVLGLGQSSTIILGVVVAVAFFVGALVLMGRLDRLLDVAVWVALLVSPAVMLGVERGNADLIVFPVVVAGVVLIRARARTARVVAHGAMLFAAMLKLFPAFAFVVLLRQSPRRILAGAGPVTLGFFVYIAATWSDIATIHRVLPQEIYYSYGADVAVRAVATWLAARYASLASVATYGTFGDEQIVMWCAVLVALVLALVVARRWKPPAVAHERELDAFFAGCAIYAGSFLLEHNFDYRLVYLLFVVPQLLRWARSSRFAAGVLLVLVSTLWLSEVLSNGYWRERNPLPYDELLTWFLFTTLLGMAAAVAAPRIYPLLRAGGFSIGLPHRSQ